MIVKRPRPEDLQVATEGAVGVTTSKESLGVLIREVQKSATEKRPEQDQG